MSDEEVTPRPRKQADAWRAYGTVKAGDNSTAFHKDFTNIWRIFPGDGTICHVGCPTMGVDGLLMMQPRLNPVQFDERVGIAVDPFSRDARRMG